MSRQRITWGLIIGLSWCMGAQAEPEKVRLLLVDSYHKEYEWSKDTSRGLAEGLLKFHYFDDAAQVEAFLKADEVESSRAVVKRIWMDTKRKSSKPEMAAQIPGIIQAAKEFHPTLLFLGDDNAANYVGNQFLDTELPVVFWGVNNTPVKYGLVETVERPGHNVTGIYQAGYYAESLQLLKALVPQAKTFAVLSDETETGRSHVKEIESLARDGALPLRLVESVSTGEFAVWKQRALELQGQVDTFFIVQFNALKNEQRQSVAGDEVIRWYLTNIRIPETTPFETFVRQGLLCAADDSGYNQGFEGAVIAHDILAGGRSPSTYPARAPGRGALSVNRRRAQALGIALGPELGIERFVDESVLPKEPVAAKP